MGRNKFRENQKTKSHHNQSNPKTKPNTIVRRQHSQVKPSSATQRSASGKKSNTSSKPQRPPRVPFLRSDRVLLVGEGDFSFSLSLVKNYNVASVTATSYDDEQTLLSKYPNIQTTIDQLQPQSQNPSGQSKTLNETQHDTEWNGFSGDEQDRSASDTGIEGENDSERTQVSILYGIDATKLSSTHKKTLNRHTPFTKIVFNFPHTGGLSTDVNRQVRANQELVVSFFSAAKPFLLTKSHDKFRDEDFDVDTDYDNDATRSADLTSKRPCILVTLFEREPYTLWNIRDLARHCGLEVIESFKFPWAAYPGYQHARTVGDITTGLDRTEEGKRKGAWRGEERDARCYVFGLKVEDSQGHPRHRRGKKGTKSEDESD